ncbi:hypothetical protein ACTXT7_010115 [Hymenolepis weldensis]
MPWKRPMYVDSDLEQSYLQLDERRIYRVSPNPVNDKGLVDDTLRLNIKKAKRQLVMIESVLRSKVLSIKARAKLLGTFINPILLYDLSCIVYRKIGDNKLKAI